MSTTRKKKSQYTVKKSQYIEREEKRNKKRLIKEEAQKCERHIVQYVEK